MKKLDLIGKKYGRLIVLEKVESYASGHSKFLCLCDCGNKKEIAGSALSQGLTVSCGCLKKEKASKKGIRKIRELAGLTFGRLTVIKRDFDNCLDGRSAYWTCQCSCGVVKTICGANLVRPNGTKSCGCLAKELSVERGKLKSLPEGEACFNALFYHYKRNAQLRDYKFELNKKQFKQIILLNCFYCDSTLSNLYSARCKTGSFRYNGIDRIDNTKGYCLSNCVPCCGICNRMKLTMLQDDFKAWIKKAYQHWASK